MDEETRALVEAILERAGSQHKAAEMIGVTVRHVQKWAVGHSAPSPRSCYLIRVALDGDDTEQRRARIARYARLVARGRSPFGARRSG